ncbi:MAG: PadR family transcriptional regulator [Alphaproteobacteria bacterium]|nr:PadR family transcriptional regulator [Alphaproteobacteria bacterium]
MDVRTICLGLLTYGEATGYEIKKRLEEGAIGQVTGVSFGAIYPALTRLAEDGLLSARDEPQDKRPDKKVYALTEKGRAALIEALLEPVGEDRFRSPFIFVMSLADLLPPERVQRLIDQRIAWVEEKRRDLEIMFEESTSEAQRFTCGYGLAVHGAELAYLRTHRRRLEECLAGERAGTRTGFVSAVEGGLSS